MERFRKLVNKRFKFLEDNQDTLFDVIRLAEGQLYKELLKFILDLEIDGKGNLLKTAKNIKTLRNVNQIVDSFNKTKSVSIIDRIIKSVKELFKLNKEYFDTVKLGIESEVEQKARQSVFLNLGYNEKLNEVIEGGYLYQITKNNDIAGKVAIQINAAIIGKMPLKQFEKQFFDTFVNPVNGIGMYERFYKSNVFDLMQKVDRSIQTEYSIALGLNYAIYAGTKISTSRDFCIQRLNKIYTKEEIAKWKNLSFSGKPKVGYEPLRDAGGIFCRHILNWISDELSEELIKTQGVNNYNAVPPKTKDKNKKKSIFE